MGRLSVLVAGARTTPGRLRVLRGATVALVALLAMIGTLVGARSTSGTQAITATSEPLVVNAVAIYHALADANTVATQAFLSGGLEPAPQVARFDEDISELGRLLTDSAARVGSTGRPANSIRTLTEQLPVYTGLIQSARANNRQGLPVGSAYLAEADDLVRSVMLPAADQLLAEEQQQLADDYAAAQEPSFLVLEAAVALALAAALGVTQAFLSRRTRRTLNVGLVAASVVLILTVAVVGLIAMLQSVRFDDARHHGTDPLDRAAHARIAALVQRSDASMILVSRSSSAEFDADFQSATAALLGSRGGPGLLTRDSPAAKAAQAYAATHAQVMARLSDGDYDGAVSLESSTDATGGTGAFATLDAAIAKEVSQSQQRFTEAIRGVESMMAVLTAVVPIGCALIALFAILGIRPRLEEYR